MPIGAQEAVSGGDCSPDVDSVDRHTAPLATKVAKEKGSGSLCRITVFIRHENVVRLLEFLGYCLE